MIIMKFLGIDYGTKKTGLAFSDEEGSFAFPDKVVPTTKTLSDDIAALCAEQGVTGIVVGESLNYQGDPNKVMEEITPFVEALKQKVNIPIYLEPEFMTSAHVRTLQVAPRRERGEVAQRKGKHGMIVDASSAALILQTFLDKQKKSNT